MDDRVNAGKSRSWRKPGSRAASLGLAAGTGTILLLYAARAYYVASVDEDTYISLRYARNLLDGAGLVWNPGGERVEGITNLLWTLILAGFSGLSGVGLPATSLALGAVSGALTLLVTYLWCREEMFAGGFSRNGAVYGALAVPLLLVLAPGFVFYAVSGLEVPFFALLVTGGLYALSRNGSLLRYVAGGAMLGAAALARPEGALVLAFGVGASVLVSGGRIWKAAAAALPGIALLAAATLWRLWYYGSPVPNTFFVRAKGLEVIEQWGLPYLTQAAQASWFPVAWLLAVGGALLSRGFLVRNLAVLSLAPVWCAYVAYAGGDYMPAFRLVVPILPMAYVLGVVGFAWIYRAALVPAGSPPSARLAVLGVPLLAVAAFAVLQVPAQLAVERQHKIDNDRWTEYRRSVGEALEALDPDALVAANAVGALGYYSDLRILDMLGLNEAHVARHGAKDPQMFPGHQVGDGRYVLSREPDYIVPYGVKPIYRVDRTAPYFVGDRELASLPEFHAEYEAVTIELANDLETEGGDEASMFRRKPGAD